MPRKLNGLVCNTCRTFIAYSDDAIIGWQVTGIKVACLSCQSKGNTNENEKQNS